MPKDKLADELIALRRQIALLTSRAKQIEIAMNTVPQIDRDMRPGWPIQRLDAASLPNHAL